MAEDLWLHLESGERTQAPWAHVERRLAALQPGLGLWLWRCSAVWPWSRPGPWGVCLLVPTCRPPESPQEQRRAGAWSPQPGTPVLTTQQPVSAASWWACPWLPVPPNLCGHREARPRGSGPPVLAQVWMKPPQLSAVRRVWMSVPGGGQQGSRLYIRCVLFIPSLPTHVRALVGEVSLSEIWREQRKGPRFFPLGGGW